MVRPTVIFDLGGVLVGVDFMRACRRLSAVAGLPPGDICEAILGGTEKAAHDAGRLDSKAFAARCCAKMGLDLPYSEFVEAWCDIFVEQREVTCLLDEIAVHADLVLLSNTDSLHFDFLRRRYDFLGKFAKLVLSYEVGHAKPERQIFERALGACARGSRVIYFDDVAEFVAAARACGLPAEQFVGVDKLVRDLMQFDVLQHE